VAVIWAYIELYGEDRLKQVLQRHRSDAQHHFGRSCLLAASCLGWPGRMHIGGMHIGCSGQLPASRWPTCSQPRRERRPLHAAVLRCAVLRCAVLCRRCLWTRPRCRMWARTGSERAAARCSR
jgi:hypothetical protein